MLAGTAGALAASRLKERFLLPRNPRTQSLSAATGRRRQGPAAQLRLPSIPCRCPLPRRLPSQTRRRPVCVDAKRQLLPALALATDEGLHPPPTPGHDSLQTAYYPPRAALSPQERRSADRPQVLRQPDLLPEAKTAKALRTQGEEAAPLKRKATSPRRVRFSEGGRHQPPPRAEEGVCWDENETKADAPPPRRRKAQRQARRFVCGARGEALAAGSPPCQSV